MQKRSLAEILTGAVVLAVAAAVLAYAITGSGRALTTSGMSLTARFDRNQKCQKRNQGLSRADIPLQKPVHPLVGCHIGGNLGAGTNLRRRRLIW